MDESTTANVNDIINNTIYLDQIPPMCTKLHSNNNNDILEAVIFFRKLLAIDKISPIHIIIQYDIVPILLTLIITSNVTVQNEIAWTITNIACGDMTQLRYLCTARSLPIYPNNCNNNNNNNELPVTHNLLSVIYHILLRYHNMKSTNSQMELLIEHILWIIGTCSVCVCAYISVYNMCEYI